MDETSHSFSESTSPTWSSFDTSNIYFDGSFDMRSEDAVETAAQGRKKEEETTLRQQHAHAWALSVHTCRAEFWEIYSKEMVRLWSDFMQENLERKGGDRSATTSDHEQELQSMAECMKELGESLNSLKKQSDEEHERVNRLTCDLKRTERVKNSYKREIKTLKAMLDSMGTCHKATSSKEQEHLVSTLQGRIASMRIQLDTSKGRVDQERAEKRVLEGTCEELKDRCRRREQALASAQKRCRDLEASLASKLEEDTIRADNDGSIAMEETSSPCEEKDPSTSIDDDLVSEEISLQICRNVKEQQPTLVMLDIMTSTDDLSANPAHGVVIKMADEDCLEEEHEQDRRSDSGTESIAISSIPPLLIGYDKIIGHFTPEQAEGILISVDDALTQCIKNIHLLSQQLHEAREESDQLKSLCATQYDEIYKGKCAIKNLEATVSHLENHVQRIQKSSAEYQHHMEFLVQQQRQTAAEESHHTTAELQLMSQEQARLLLKLRAVESDLEKSRALCNQMAYRMQSFEVTQKQQHCPHTDQSDETIPAAVYPYNAVQEPSSIVDKLQHIAKGLEGLGQRKQAQDDSRLSL